MSFKKKIKGGWEKFWFLIWKDDSFKGWLVSLIVLFIFVKFIFFPAMNLATGTPNSLLIVESCSMYHQGNLLSSFSSWYNAHETKYENLDIIKSNFSSFPLKRGFTKGDIVFSVRANPDKLKVGDVIIFKSNSGALENRIIIHRIVQIQEKDGEKVFTTMGDNNAQSLTAGNNIYKIDETTITSDRIVAKAVLRLVPYAGWGKLIFFEFQKSEQERGFCSGK